MLYGYKETRLMNADDLRQLCITRKWFTRGNNEDYNELLKMTDKENITSDDIVEMATIILNFSEKQNEPITTIMFYLAQICTTHFEEI